MIQDTNAHLTYDKLPTVRADAMQLVQLFQNLISNAIKFRGPEHPEVHISAHAEDGDWVFSVRDNGIGIEKEYWDQIFTMFRRLHTKKEYPGTGIGLAICKKIVERHGGRIWLDSIPGEGTTFYFTLVGMEES
jgi:light-regulated signal transduction histidine kinase (bacteriophytochrome)